MGEARKRTDQTPYLLTVDGGKSWVLGNTYKGKFYCANVDPVSFFNNIGEIITEVMALVNPRVFEIKLDKIKEELDEDLLKERKLNMFNWLQRQMLRQHLCLKNMSTN